MDSKKKYIFLISIFFFIYNSFCQNQNSIFEFSPNIRDSFDMVYGYDPVLFNGKLYNYYPQNNVIGNQYFNDDNYKKGEITIRGKKYRNLNLNYDIFNQELVLWYNNSFGYTSSFVISKAWLEQFTIGESKFKLFVANNFPERIYQVIGNDSVQIYYYLKKELKLSNVSGISKHIFTLEKTLYVCKNKYLKQYYNNRSFIKLFDTKNQAQIKEFIRKNKIKVKKSPVQVMEKLIDYCNGL